MHEEGLTSEGRHQLPLLHKQAHDKTGKAESQIETTNTAPRTRGLGTQGPSLVVLSFWQKCNLFYTHPSNTSSWGCNVWKTVSIQLIVWKTQGWSTQNLWVTTIRHHPLSVYPLSTWHHVTNLPDLSFCILQASKTGSGTGLGTRLLDWYWVL